MKARLLAGVLVLGCSHAEPAPTTAAPTGDPIASFETVRAVMLSPRCVNCHPAGDAPTQGDGSRVHQEFVQRGPAGRGRPGLECTTCHARANPPASYGAHLPPGVSVGWRMPPPEQRMVFAGMSSAALCEQLKDPKQNGGRSMAQMVEHASTDPLVLWAWAPGFGRAPVPVPHEEFAHAFKTWADAGAPCPPVHAASNP